MEDNTKPTVRIYLVKTGDAKRLIKATSPSQAISHCVRKQFTAEIAGQWDLVDLLDKKTPIEDALAKKKAA